MVEGEAVRAVSQANDVSDQAREEEQLRLFAPPDGGRSGTELAREDEARYKLIWYGEFRWGPQRVGRLTPLVWEPPLPGID